MVELIQQNLLAAVQIAWIDEVRVGAVVERRIEIIR